MNIDPIASLPSPSAPAVLAAAVFDALSDPTRRSIFERLCGEPQAVGVLAEGLPVSRPAVSQHLRALERAQLVVAHREGTRRIYSVHTEGLAALRSWVEHHWDVVLDRFADAAEAAEREARLSEQAVQSNENRGDPR
ncbi:MAG: metalloregulator ArsR/SmtB family transcription factor [Thermoanaerobaculia bacterium]|nr:metalloregulator ArsR/SmtB family transcription factor [Thermoanaerobaculia bacterium]